MSTVEATVRADQNFFSKSKLVIFLCLDGIPFTSHGLLILWLRLALVTLARAVTLLDLFDEFNEGNLAAVPLSNSYANFSFMVFRIVVVCSSSSHWKHPHSILVAQQTSIKAIMNLLVQVAALGMLFTKWAPHWLVRTLTLEMIPAPLLKT